MLEHNFYEGWKSISSEIHVYRYFVADIYRISKTQKDSYGYCSTENVRQFNLDEYKVDM